MKRVMFVMITMLLIVIFTSCIPVAHRDIELPQGIWRSVEPNIVLYIENEYISPVTSGYLGVYATEYEEVKVFAGLDVGPLRFTIFREDSFDPERNSVSMAGAIFVGRFEMHDDEMRIVLDNRTREQTGYEVIIFHRTEDYEPINPDDWFLRH